MAELTRRSGLPSLKGPVWKQWLVLSLLIPLVPAILASAAEWVLHDDFSTSEIDPEKWFGSGSREARSRTETHRFVAEGQLHLSAIAYGGVRSNRGRQTSSLGLGIRVTGPLTALQATIRVRQATAGSCPANPLSSQSRAQLVGYFFNDGTRTSARDLQGDVVAILEAVADSQAGHFIRAIVLRCTSRSCAQGDVTKAILFDRKWRLNESYVFRMAWQPERFQFVFTVNPGVEGEEAKRIAYDPELKPQRGLRGQHHRIRLRQHGANCQSARQRTVMTASVDDVYLGAAATPPQAESAQSRAARPPDRSSGGLYPPEGVISFPH